MTRMIGPTWLAVVAIPLLAACGGGTKKRTLSPQEMIVADPLPLAKGAKWTVFGVAG